MSSAERLIDMCDNRCARSRWNLIWRTNFKDYSDGQSKNNNSYYQYGIFTLDQAHSLLIKALAVFIYGVQTLISDSKLMVLVKAAIRIQASFSMLRFVAHCSMLKLKIFNM